VTGVARVCEGGVRFGFMTATVMPLAGGARLEFGFVAARRCQGHDGVVARVLAVAVKDLVCRRTLHQTRSICDTRTASPN